MKKSKTATKANGKPAATQPVIGEFIGRDGQPHHYLDFEPSNRYGVRLGLKAITAVLNNLDAAKAYVASGGSKLR